MRDPSAGTSVRPDGFTRAALAVATFALLFRGAVLLFALPAVGMADHGDYYRVARPAGIFVGEPRVDDLGRPLLQRTYAEGESHLSRGATSASVVALAAKRVGYFGAPGTFDLRQGGATYLGLAALLVGAALALGTHPGACFVLTWVLCDPSYLAYLNSLYSEPPALLALFGLSLFLLRWGRLPTLVARSVLPRSAVLVLLLLLGGFSRAAMALLPCIVLVLLFLRWLVARPRIESSGLALSVALTAVAVAPPLYFTVGPGPRFARINAFHAIFQGPLALSDDRAGMLRALGLPANAADLAGKSYFEAKPSPALERRLSRLSLGKRVGAYAREPVTALRMARIVVHHLVDGDVQPNYETYEAVPRDRAVWAFHRLRRTVLGAIPLLPWAAFLLMGAFIVGAALGRVRPVIPFDALALLGIVSFTQLFIAVLGDGQFGLGRHLVVARYAFDSACALLLVEACVRVLPWLRRRGASA